MELRGNQRRLQILAATAGALALACGPLCAQTHKVAASPENVVRAVGVYEWTGDMAKPTASRLIPVSLFIDGKLVDASVYLARPVPMALLTGNRYELERAGIVQGNLDLAFSRHFVAAETSGSAYDDGWFGYGKFSPPSLEKPAAALKGSAVNISLSGLDEDDSKPHFSARSATPGSGGAAGSTTGAGGAGGPGGSGSTPADDPDRPTLHRAGGSDQSASGTGDTGSGSTPADDPDRPTLRRRSSSSADAKGDQGSVSGVGAGLNDDPNRPVLHRGKPESALNELDIPKLTGLPGDEGVNALHQMAAISDAKDRDPHNFLRPWDDEAEHQAILGKLETVARTTLAAYEAANGVAPQAPPAKPSPAKPGSAAHRTTARKTTPPPPPEALLDEQLTGYTLSYGGEATFVYHAHTDGLGATQRFVTLVAQLDMQGEPLIALKNVTDAAHLDRTPRMRLVDAVDAEASNRASLLFELRAQNSRQFALYRVIGGRAEQIFLTGSTQ
jgi:hypothetical protein